MIRGFLIVSLLALAPCLNGAEPLVGHIIDNTVYENPDGDYSVRIPALPELGGVVYDTPNVVTFQDQFNLHASIACFPMDATNRWEFETQGTKDYLIWFFRNVVQADFQRQYPGSTVQSALFLKDLRGGSLMVFNLLPGGSMFANRITLLEGEAPPVAKRGNLLFVHDKRIYILSIELAERVLERSAYDKTTPEEDILLQKRLMSLLERMSFKTP